MSRRMFCLLIGALALSACAPLTSAAQVEPTAAQTQLPSPAPSPAPSLVPEPSPVPSQTVEPSLDVPASWQEFAFSQFEQLSVWYDPLVWMPDKAPGQGFLVNQGLAGCQITDQSDTQPTAFDPAPLTLGAVQYQLAQLEQDGQRFVWYRLVGGLPGNPYPSQGITPVLIVVAPLPQADACIRAAQIILATLHLFPR